VLPRDLWLEPLGLSITPVASKWKVTRKALLKIVDGRDSKALRLTHLPKNLDIGDPHAAVTLVAKGTRWFASINTQYNPIFGVISFACDA
jgi:hypothetical protein